MLAAVDLREFAVVELVGLPVVGEQIDGDIVFGRLDANAGVQRRAIGIADHPAPDVGKHVKQLAGILTMLFGQITHNRVEFRPYQRFRDKTLRIAPCPLIPLTHGDHFRRRNNKFAVPLGMGDRGQLEQVAGHDDL